MPEEFVIKPSTAHKVASAAVKAKIAKQKAQSDADYEAIKSHYHIPYQWVSISDASSAETPPNIYTSKPQKPIPESFMTQKIGDVFTIRSPKSVVADFGDDFLKHNPHLVPEKPYVFAEPKLHIGLEVEIENILTIDPSLPFCFWIIETDDSLRNNGREFKTLACPLKYIEPALKQLFFGLNNNISFSKRTSIHAHIDVRQLTPEQALGMVMTYGAMENVLFKFISLERRRNIFCVPITETDLFTGVWRSPESLFQNLEHIWKKYTAVNMLPIKRFGTLEFRHMPGSQNIQHILIWLDMLSRLRVYAYRNSFADIMETIGDLNTSSQYRKFVESVMGDLTPHLDTSGLLQDMEKPVYMIKNCSINNTFHQTVIEKVEIESGIGKHFKVKDNSTSKMPTSKEIWKYKSLRYIKNTLPGSFSDDDAWHRVFETPEVLQQYLDSHAYRDHVLFLLEQGPNPWKKSPTKAPDDWVEPEEEHED
jgi:hypothetical protein